METEKDIMELIKVEYATWFANEPMPPHADAFMKMALESFGRLAYLTGYSSAAHTIAKKMGIDPTPISV